MGKYDLVIRKYKKNGVSDDNIDYAKDAAIEGLQRQHILENLTADYRKMDYETADAMLTDFYNASGGEFKVENKRGYLNGLFLLIVIGLPCTFYTAYFFLYGGILPIWVGLGAFFGTLGGIAIIVHTIKGNYRDSDSPFNHFEN